MIDFRYHLVSLISVFLALAVGIALGAGPLKESIGDTLTGQVDQLRTEKDALRVELDQATVDLGNQGAALTAIAPDVLDGLLPGRRIAIVVVGVVDPAVVDAVAGQLTAAGAAVSARVALTDQWTDPTRTSFRGTLAGTLVGYLDPAPAADAGTGVELAEALVQALATASPTDVDALSENASVVLDLLSGDAGLITVDAAVSVPADAVVVIAGPIAAEVTPATSGVAGGPGDAAAPQTLKDESEAATEIAKVAQARTAGVVVTGDASTDPGPLFAVRSEPTLASSISTVDTVRGVAGQVAVPMALSSRISGVVGHFGTGDLATAVMPDRLAVMAPVRVPTAQGLPTAPLDPSPGATAGAQQG